MAKLEISKVHDAYQRGGECPLCDLEEAAEQTYLRSFHHSRVMEPSVRVQTNKEGFCAEHLRKLYAGENKLGIGLVIHTRLEHVAAELGDILGQIGGKHGVSRSAERVRALEESCFLCRLMGQDLQRYAFTILYLWTRDPDFPAVFRASRGFCLPHFRLMLEEGLRSMRADRLERWLAEAGPLMRESLRTLERDLHAFTQLHRAENPSLGTDAERTALARTLQKLAGGPFR
jgi:hypothetical protein